MKVKIKKLSSIAKIPSYAKYGDAGMDFMATRIIEETEDQVTYGTDLAIEIPEGYVGLIFPRSSIRKYKLSLANCIGVIDAGYRGELMAVFNKRDGLHSVKYNVGVKGDNIFQMIIMPFPKIELEEVKVLTETERGDGGFGSTNLIK